MPDMRIPERKIQAGNLTGRTIPGQRISISIQEDVTKLKGILQRAHDDRRQLLALVKDPIGQLELAGLDLAQYATPQVTREQLSREIDTAVRGILVGDILQKFHGTIANTDYMSTTSTEYSYNFDHSTSSDYTFESHTGTTRGTFSETSTSESTNTDTHFNGLTMNQFEEIVIGPLISDGVLNIISQRVEKILAGSQR